MVRAGERLIEQGAQSVIIKQGEHGALYQSREDRFVTPAFPVETLRDPTGAGDSFAGGFLGWLARSGRRDGQALRQALGVGAVMASLAIEDFSPRRLVEASHEDISSRLKVLHRMVNYELEAAFPPDPS